MHKLYNRSIKKSKSTIVFLSTYPPRECGIATFTHDLLKASQNFLGPDVACKVAALNRSPLDTYKYPPEVEWKINQNSAKDHEDLAEIINDDVNISGVIIQHEYGIFGGQDGDVLLTFMQKCTKPMLVTLHTVLPEPSEKMKEVTNSIVSLADTVVVLTDGSKKIVKTLYPDSSGKVFTIPHGIHHVTFSLAKSYKAKLRLDNHIVLSTFGLLSRGKGIEYVLRALPNVIKKYPSVIYLILGETHPVIQREEGEKYRTELAQHITELGLENHVRFYDQYFSLPDLFEFLKATDIYIATSTNPNQAVSGTLSYALGTGRAVISTEFAQAKEIVTLDNGRLIPIKDSDAITRAMIDLLGDEKRLMQMHKNAYRKTRPMVWETVAKKYLSLLERIVIPPIKTDHLAKMTDDFGLFQFATHAVPNKKFGYTLDDNARAMIVTSWLLKISRSKKLEKLLKIYLAFIDKCQLQDGSFINYINFKNKSSTSQNNDEDIQDCQMRAVWALSEIIRHDTLSEKVREEAKRMFLLNFNLHAPLIHLRAKAFAIKAYALAVPFLSEHDLELKAKIQEYADFLLKALDENSLKSWRWFEQDLNYNNALLPESLLIAGKILNNDEFTRQGLASLEFLISKTFSDEMYMPIGHSNWYKNRKERSNFDQQPEDPASMIIALTTAYYYTGHKHYKNLANTCFSWFLGNNSLKMPLYDPQTGGCYDGLHPDRVNQNQGAESLVSYLMSNVIICELT